MTAQELGGAVSEVIQRARASREDEADNVHPRRAPQRPSPASKAWSPGTSNSGSTFTASSTVPPWRSGRQQDAVVGLLGEAPGPPRFRRKRRTEEAPGVHRRAGRVRKRVEGGEKAMALAKELRVSLPTMYNTLERAGWRGGKR